MSEPAIFECRSAAPRETADLAAALAPLLTDGDVILLEGAIGAGKTHFARSMIQCLQGPDSAEDVPSPTFTLVQIYETRTCPVWHADLYRLSAFGEVHELGLVEAFETAICLVEWPDRLGSDRPDDPLTVRFEPRGTGSRQITIHGNGRWASRLAGLTSTAHAG